MSYETINIDIQKTQHSRLPGLDINNLPFGKVFSDHMFLAEYKDGKWGRTRIVPYGNLQMSPASSVLH